MPEKCSFCQQQHDPNHLCDCKEAINHLLWAGHIEVYGTLDSGNYSFQLKKLSPEADYDHSQPICKVALKKAVRPKASEIIREYVKYGLRFSWFTQAQLDNPMNPFHHQHKLVDKKWK